MCSITGVVSVLLVRVTEFVRVANESSDNALLNSAVVPVSVPSDKSSVNTPLDSLGLKNIRYTTVPRRRTGKWYFLFAATVLRQQRGLPNYTARKRQLVQSLGSRNVFLLLILGLPVIYPIFKFIFEQLMGIDSSVRGIIEDERPDIAVSYTHLTLPTKA